MKFNPLSSFALVPIALPLVLMSACATPIQGAGDLSDFGDGGQTPIDDSGRPSDLGDGGRRSVDSGGSNVLLEFDISGVQDITKISYEFVSGTENIASEESPSGPLFSVNNPALIGKTWRTTVMVWFNVNGFQELYRYRDDLTFSGHTIVLPAPPDSAWVSLIFTETSGVRIFRSSDPRTSYTIEIELPAGVMIKDGSFDRTYYNEKSDQIADQIYMALPPSSNQTIVASLPDQSVAPSDLHFVDSMLILIDDRGHAIGDYFLWEINNGVCTPVNF